MIGRIALALIGILLSTFALVVVISMAMSGGPTPEPAKAALGTLIPGLALVTVLAGAYFLPTIVAVRRHKPNMDAIFALNLLLGWTLLGWVGALVWSLTDEANPRPHLMTTPLRPSQ